MVLYLSIQNKIEFGFRGEKDTGLLRDKPFIARVKTNNKLNTQGIAMLVTGVYYELFTRITPKQTEEEKGLYIPFALHIKLTKISHSKLLISGNTNK